MYRFISTLIVLSLSCAAFVHCRNHDINIKNDKRHAILLSHFGYNPNALLHLSILKMDINATGNHKFGISLSPSSSGVASYVESSPSKCFLDERQTSALFLRFDNINSTITVESHGASMGGLLVYEGVNFTADSNSTQQSIFNITPEVRLKLMDNFVKLFGAFVSKANATEIANQTIQLFKHSNLFTKIEQTALLNVFAMRHPESARANINIISDLKMILIMARKALGAGQPFSGQMALLWQRLQAPVTFKARLPVKLLIEFPTATEEGDFDLYFHNCAHGNVPNVKVNLTATLIEKNWNSYLSAGDQPLPLLFFIMCSAYIVLTIIWSLTLFTSEHAVFKIHYLMLALLVMKSLTLFFHGINYYELGRNGVPEQGWAIMYYITHLLKGALLFTTIILIGAGWAFIKHMLSGKEKKIFIIIIPLQILANVAAIIIDESEESAARYLTWRNIFLLVDLVCCGAILFPVIWSIKHLKEAANIDGKQAHNLLKLRLFRHFYILIICYIYFTRIIVYLLVITVSFKLTWTVDLFRELSTLFFMVVTGYKFRPVSNNPYLLVPLDGDEDQVTEEMQMEHAWSQSGVTDGVLKINQLSRLDSDDDDNGDDSDTVYEKTPLATVNGNGFVHTSAL